MIHHLKLDNLITTPEESSIQFKHFTFNGGEEHIQIAAEYVDTDPRDQAVVIEVSLVNSSKVMQLLIATDALKRLGFQDIRLFAPYLPYARQDRVCNPGEALSVKVMCDLINSQNYSKVYTLDNHSDVSNALLNNHQEIDLEGIIRRSVGGLTEYALVSPDAGALKKTYKLAKALGGLPVIECGKKRDTTTGEILQTLVHTKEHSLHKKMLIVDDICDGGRTFTELAKALKSNDLMWREEGIKLELFVSHGIFSKGFDVFKGLIDKIYTTDSFYVPRISRGMATWEKFNANDL